jgi:hypothetical protein
MTFPLAFSDRKSDSNADGLLAGNEVGSLLELRQKQELPPDRRGREQRLSADQFALDQASTLIPPAWKRRGFCGGW